MIYRVEYNWRTDGSYSWYEVGVEHPEGIVKRIDEEQNPWRVVVYFTSNERRIITNINKIYQRVERKENK